MSDTEKAHLRLHPSGYSIGDMVLLSSGLRKLLFPEQTLSGRKSFRESKIRCHVVVEHQQVETEWYLIVVPFTSTAEKSWGAEGRYLLQPLEENGLCKPSLAGVWNVFAIPTSKVRCKVGALDSFDREAVRGLFYSFVNMMKDTLVLKSTIVP